MKINCPPGVHTDMAPLSPEPFWFYGQNVRFRKGIPETIGLFGKVLDAGDNPITIAVGGETVSMFSDKTLVLFGYGNKILAVQYPGGTSRQFTFTEAGTGGRWWFTSTEDDIICGRSNFDGKTYVLHRADIFNFGNDPVSLLANAPIGGRAAGIVGGILIKAGTTGVAGDGPKMLVRWSARRTDEPGDGGPFGFERWAADDLTASGEYPIENGSEIVGGGATNLGFVFWTDTRMKMLVSRTDSFVFGQKETAFRGLLASDCWCEADGRIWWFDQTRTLNVFDGGNSRQIENPMKHVTVEAIDDADLDQCYVSVDAEYGEIHLHYPGSDGFFREAVYNYMEDVWYPFALDRIAMTDAHGVRPSIGVTRAGDLFFYDLRETLPDELVTPDTPIVVPSIDPPSTPNIGMPEAFDFFLMTNMIAPGSVSMQSFRIRNAVLPYTYAASPESSASDTLNLLVQSYGQLDLKETPITDNRENALGKMLFKLRSGGKVVQFVIWGQGVTTMFRFGPLDVEADEGGEK